MPKVLYTPILLAFALIWKYLFRFQLTTPTPYNQMIFQMNFDANFEILGSVSDLVPWRESELESSCSCNYVDLINPSVLSIV